jgi:hypothetical protein
MKSNFFFIEISNNIARQHSIKNLTPKTKIDDEKKYMLFKNYF